MNEPLHFSTKQCEVLRALVDAVALWDLVHPTGTRKRIREAEDRMREILRTWEGMDHGG